MSHVPGPGRGNNRLILVHLALSVVTVLLAGAGASTTFFVHRQLTETNESEAESQGLLAQSAALRARLAKLQEERDRTAAERDALRAMLPSGPEESAILRQLAESAQAQGVTVSDFRPGNIVELPESKELELRLRCGGMYGDLCRWLDALDGVPRFVRITQLGIAATAATPELCEVDLQLNVQFRPEEAKSAYEREQP